MTRISSETLFNFTDTYDHLVNNLKNGIYCHPTYEKLPKRNNGYLATMACFCDIPLSMIKEHFDWYGRYGIGIRKSYARSHGVKPVWYITSESHLIDGLKSQSQPSNYERFHLLPYLKQYMGYQDLNGKETRKKFYDEREWRYIPPGTPVETAFGEREVKRVKSLNHKAHRMPIDLASIEYIIVKGPNDIVPILGELKKLSVDTSLTYENLVSKIITSRLIDRDF